MNNPLFILLQVFTVVNKTNVVYDRITSGLVCSVPEKIAGCIFRGRSEDKGSLFLQNNIHSKLFCLWKEIIPVPFGLK